MARSKRKTEPPTPEERADKVIEFIEKYCRIPEGPDVDKAVKLRDWQKDEIRKIYGNPAGTRRAIISFGRKNAKSTLAAFLLLVHLCGPEARRNSQLFSAAQSREQAGLIFNLAAKIVRMSPKLLSVIVIRDTAKQLFCPELGTLYRTLSAEASTAYGLSPVFIVHDELGQVRGSQSELYEALETATGAQAHPLSVIISTQAPSDGDLLSVLMDDALQRTDERVTVSLYTAPIEDDPFAEATIRKANPAFGDFLNPKEVMAMAEDARRMPSREAEFRNLVLNQRVQAVNPFISEYVWQLCNGAVQADWGKAEVYGGLDLSATKDLTALVLVAKIGDQWQVKPTFWLPDEGLRERSRLDHVAYDVWKRDGYLYTTPGKSVEYDWVAHSLREICNSMRIKKIAFDRWQFHHLRSSLQRNGFGEKEIEDKFVEFGQGYKSMSPALRTLESLVLNKKIAHAGHPVLKMCAANAVVTRDPADNRKLDKAKAHGRIDGMVALAMAVGVAEAAKEKPRQPQLIIV
jgi:phage terminase large subunit-like protein